MYRKSFTIAALLAAGTSAASAANFLPTFTAQPNQVIGQNGWTASALYTIGDTLPNGFAGVGILDGIGAYALDKNTVRILVNSENSATSGYTYTVNNGTVALKGSRVSYYDIDKTSKGVVNAGLAYSNIYDRAGNLVTNAAQVGGGFNRFCSSAAFEANSFGTGRGLTDRIYFAGEESGNGTMYALDTATGNYHAVPRMGRAAFENATQIDTGTTDKVAFIIADDTAGSALMMYVGTKDTTSGASFLARNGLANGQLYAWKSGAGDTTATTFGGGNGDSRSGSWVALTVFDASKAGTAGYDALGYANAATLQAEADAKGAFSFSRPEDVATNPSDPTLIAFASTGIASFNGGVDTHGTVYTVKTTFDANGNPVSGTTTIVYNGNLDASHALRSPDNLDWNGADHIIIQEDRANGATLFALGNANEAGILDVGLDGSVTAVARISRLAVPAGQTDSNPTDFGNWETSGILDVSHLFGYTKRGSLFIGDVQAHSINLGSGNLVEGGQLFLLRSAVPEPASWAMMIAGLGLVGSALRRRNRAIVAA